MNGTVPFEPGKMLSSLGTVRIQQTRSFLMSGVVRLTLILPVDVPFTLSILSLSRIDKSVVFSSLFALIRQEIMRYFLVDFWKFTIHVVEILTLT